jgi:Zn-dependent protease with chaperone function
MSLTRLTALLTVALLGAACAGPTTSSGPTTRSPQPSPQPQPTAGREAPRPIDAAQAERLQRLMTPLIKAMNNPRPLNKVKIGLVDDPSINAANAGDAQFMVTTGLLQKANDDQLQAVLAHEVAHEDLGHVAKAQTLGAGLNIGMIILDQIIPGSGAITPIAGELVARGYSRREEYEADRHGVELLRQIGRPKEQMIDALTWLMKASGPSGGGFLATHPATGDRIEALKKMD